MSTTFAFTTATYDLEAVTVHGLGYLEALRDVFGPSAGDPAGDGDPTEATKQDE